MNGQKLRFSLLSSVIVLGLSWVQSVSAAERWHVFANTVWVSGDSRLTLEMPSVAHPYLRVTSNTAADLQWIEAGIPFKWGATIKSIVLCYQAPDPGTFISQVRLADYALPTPATVRHDDGTDLTSSTGECYVSDVTDFVPSGALNLSLRLNFANPGDEIRIGGLAVLIDE